MGKVKKGEGCSVSGCGNPAVRSLSPAHASEMKQAGYSLSESGRLYLCEPHYKEFKKLRSKEDRLEKWRFSG
ncbi:MAG: hypothetical protein QFX35_07345 [Candidatus Verstraetearchaeota archaeon]|nr:hypothetical protein [Candidatus Verstraetearchaeota archaeon]